MDDLKITTHGIQESHVDMHQQMGANPILDLKGIEAKVSRKNVCLSAKHKHGLKLARHYAAKGVSTSVKPMAKYLGLGTTGGVRRTMGTIKDRIKGARPRNKQVGW